MLLGSYLNNAVVAIENDKYGYAANAKLKTIYPRIYVQTVEDKTTRKLTEKIGWDTTAVTRSPMLAQMQEEIYQGALDLKSKRLIKECLTFIENPKTKKAEAQEGCFDDFVIAAAISGRVRQLMPYVPPRPRYAEENREARPRNARFRFGKKN